MGFLCTYGGSAIERHMNEASHYRAFPSPKVEYIAEAYIRGLDTSFTSWIF